MASDLRRSSENAVNKFVFSFCTLVTDHEMYASLKASASKAGFEGDCEFLKVDNAQPPQLDAYKGLNSLIAKATGKYIICCHQDILFDFDSRTTLEARLRELDDMSADWAVCGVAGMTSSGMPITRITDKYGEDQKTGTHPSEVHSLDECFLVLRSDSGVRFSSDIGGFHFYGTDICLIASMLGFKTFAIDFHLRHLGGGAMGKSFEDAKASFLSKWRHAFRDRTVWTTSDRVFLTGNQSRFSALGLRAWISRKAAKRMN